MRIEIDDETSVELMEDGVCVTGREFGEDRVHAVMVPFGEKTTEALATVHRIMKSHALKDKLDGQPHVEARQIWRHHEGTFYEIVDIGEHTESNDMLVLYRGMAGTGNKIWARPLSMWHDDMGDGVPRFKFAEEDED